jgi:hypothetical protein
MAMKCRLCASERVHRSQRKGLKEGLWLRLVFRAPYRCRECGTRFYAYTSETERGGHDRSFVEYLGLAGKEYRVRQWLVTAAMVLILLTVSIVLLLRVIDG